jgi:hypothetical protein
VNYVSYTRNSLLSHSLLSHFGYILRICANVSKCDWIIECILVAKGVTLEGSKCILEYIHSTSLPRRTNELLSHVSRVFEFNCMYPSSDIFSRCTPSVTFKNKTISSSKHTSVGLVSEQVSQST